MTACTIVGLREAWDIWWSGEKIENYCIYSYSVINIGRVAKVLGFISGLAIVVDIVERDKMEKYGDSLRGILKLIVPSLNPGNQYYRIRTWIGNALFYLMLSVGALFLVSTILSILTWFYGKVSGNPIFVQNYYIEQLKFYLFILLIPFSIGGAVLYISDIMTNSQYARIIKIGAFFLLIFSFCFDMLAS